MTSIENSLMHQKDFLCA